MNLYEQHQLWIGKTWFDNTQNWYFGKLVFIFSFPVFVWETNNRKRFGFREFNIAWSNCFPPKKSWQIEELQFNPRNWKWITKGSLLGSGSIFFSRELTFLSTASSSSHQSKPASLFMEYILFFLSFGFVIDWFEISTNKE